MYNQRQQQGHNVFMNGGHGHQQYGMQMNASKPFQSQQHQPHPQHRQQQDHNGHGHGGNFGSHQHNASSSGFTASTPQFNPTQLRNGTPNHLQNGLNRPPNEHWGEQLKLYRECQELSGAHPHARIHGSNKSVSSADSDRPEREQEDRKRINGDKNGEKQSWTELDLGGQALRALANGMFNFKFLTKLYLRDNNLSAIPERIGKLRALTHLDLSKNHLSFLPQELGMLVNLKTLLLFDNDLETLPYEIGQLYHLDMLGIEGNERINPEIKELMMENGTKALVSWLQDSAPMPESPPDRDWIVVDEGRPAGQESIKVLSYNTLCDKMATHAMYGYTSREALSWDHRKELILDEIRGRDADIVCLQEIDTDSFQELFRPTLAHNDYKGQFHPKSRAKWTDKEARLVDGCATFYKNSKYILLDKRTIEYANIAINRPDMKSEHDVFNRVMPRDNIAIVLLLENRQTGARLIVANTHCHWDAAYKDVKVVQVAILLEQLAKIADEYTRHPPCKIADKRMFRFSSDADPVVDENGVPIEPDVKPEVPEPQPSQEYTVGTQIPLLICIDTNSTPDSGVYELLSTGALPPNHPDFGTLSYGSMTRTGVSHPFTLKSAYSPKDLPFTNYTPGFEGMIDYIWYTAPHMNVQGLLGKVDEQYLSRCPGFPSWHYPSDHLALLAEFGVSGRKARGKVVETDFGPQGGGGSGSGSGSRRRGD